MLIATTANKQTSMASKKAFEELDMSQEEIKRIGEALKDEKFRKMFVEYAEEISNPENRKRYEEEIAMMENERGMNVEFVHPQPGFVLKTTLDGSQKAFINICTSDKIGKPNAKKHTNEEGKNGLYWQIPHSFSPPREDIDKERKKCKVYDVVFHPDTFRMTDNPRFKKMVEDTALDGIERQFECKLDRHNVRRPKLKFKGTPVATVIRSRADNSAGTTKKETSDVLKDMPYPYSNLTSEELANKKNEELKKKEAEKQIKANKTKSNIEKKEENGFSTPKYNIIHRSDLDIQEYRNAPDSKPSTRPKELVISIELPLCKSATGVALDIFEDKLALKSDKPAYKLDIKLPYQVDDELGSAKFDKTRKLLIVTLPVIPAEEAKIPSFIEDKETDRSEETNNYDNPLIQELPPLEEIEPDTLLDDPPLEDIDEESQTMETAHRSTHMVAYALPEFDYSQDSETVTIIFHVRNVNKDSVSKTFQEIGMCRVRFASLGSGGFPMHYSFCVKLEDNCELVPEHCTVDISERNMSILLLKARDKRYLWNRFMVGLDENSEMVEKLFLTEANLQSQLDSIEAESEVMGQTEEQTAHQRAKVEVTEMNHKKLSINIEPASKFSIPAADDEEYDADECPSSADIEVVHSKKTPPLHSILKQRSISESSEERQSSSSGESPTGLSPRELDGQKRGVHFSSQIDRTTYKSNMSVNSMKVTLKSKRRRNRKREEKKEKSRKRHNSTGSECSSCDEHDAKLSGESHSEDDLDELSLQLDEAGKKVSENGVIVEEDQFEKVVQEVENIDLSGISVEENADKVLNKPNCEQSEKDEVQNNGIKVKMTKGSKLVQDVKKKLAEKTGTLNREDSDDDAEEGYRTSQASVDNVEMSDENSEKIVDRTSIKAENMGIVNDLTEKSVVTSEETGTTGDIKKAADNLTDDSGTNSAMIGQSLGKGEPETQLQQCKLENGMQEKGDGVNSECDSVNKTAVKQEKESVNQSANESGTKTCNAIKDGGEQTKLESENMVETELSWKEPNRASSNNEHRSDCAFTFSNAMMFDLDVE